MQHYTYICAYNDADNSTGDFPIQEAYVIATNGQYTISFHLDSDGDGVIDTYRFYDIKSKVSGSNGSAWDFDEFMDLNEEYTDHGSLEDFGFDSYEISQTLDTIKLEFVEKYLNEASQTNLLYSAAVPRNKKDIFTATNDAGNLVFEEGDKNILLQMELP